MLEILGEITAFSPWIILLALRSLVKLLIPLMTLTLAAAIASALTIYIVHRRRKRR